MTTAQIQQIVSKGLFPGAKTGASLVETHISWVILSDEFAFKIKKPVRFDFLDFSSLELRQYFCAEELRLNRRLAPQMYVGLLPISEQGIGIPGSEIVDYAVQMNRMDNSREMDRLLENEAVEPSDLVALADLLAAFHLQNRLPADHTYHPEEEAHDFADLYPLKEDLAALQAPDIDFLSHWPTQIPDFLHTHAQRSQARIQNRFWVDGHGDLHSRNIFLPKDKAPIVFDCLEFNPHFRCSDVLNELAFLCMDLEFYGRKDLADIFLKRYRQHWECIEKPEDELLFAYFKAYRANVRLKVTLLELRQHPQPALENKARSYWELLKGYVASFLK